MGGGGGRCRRRRVEGGRGERGGIVRGLGGVEWVNFGCWMLEGGGWRLNMRAVVLL